MYSTMSVSSFLMVTLLFAPFAHVTSTLVPGLFRSWLVAATVLQPPPLFLAGPCGTAVVWYLEG